MKKSGKLAIGAASVALLTAGLGTTPEAQAGSTVYVGGYATCASFAGPVAAKSVSVDYGTPVGTSALPWRKGRYDTTIAYLPRTGANIRFVVTCPSLTNNPGAQTFYRWLKPDWRNTTGDTNFTNI